MSLTPMFLLTALVVAFVVGFGFKTGEWLSSKIFH